MRPDAGESRACGLEKPLGPRFSLSLTRAAREAERVSIFLVEGGELKQRTRSSLCCRDPWKCGRRAGAASERGATTPRRKYRRFLRTAGKVQSDKLVCNLALPEERFLLAAEILSRATFAISPAFVLRTPGPYFSLNHLRTARPHRTTAKPSAQPDEIPLVFGPYPDPNLGFGPPGQFGLNANGRV